MTAPDFPPEIIEKAAEAVPLYLMVNGRDTQRRVAEAVLAVVADDLYQRGFTDGGEEALTSALHPEFGTEWREPDGVIWKEYRRGMVEGARQAVCTCEGWRDAGHYWATQSGHHEKCPIARIEKGAGA